MNPASLLDEAVALQPRTVALRRRVHRHPELGLDLPRTRAAVLESLAGLPLELALSERTSGVVATLRGARPGRSILLRGDMDALPLREDTGLEFASEVEGRMHACGHDTHTAMLASAAHLLCARREELSGSVRFFFQPGEEGAFGARIMIEEGLLETDGPPDAAFALHVFPNLPSGVIACRPGPMLAGADTIRARIVGRGGHASMPHDACDPVPVACEAVGALQALVTRRVSVFDPAVLTVARISAGTTSNIIPEVAELEGTLRTFSPETRTAMHAGIQSVLEHVAQAHGARAEVEIVDGYPPTLNDAGFVDFVARTAEGLFGADGYHAMRDPIMGAEDFSYVLQRVPGAMAFLGAAPPGVEAATACPCHSNRMQIDEDVMARGVALHAALATSYLAS